MGNNPFAGIIEKGAKTKEYEGWRDKPYKDTKGIPTIGYGFNLTDPLVSSQIAPEVISGRRPLTKEEAEPVFQKRYTQAESDAKQFVGEETFSGLNKERQDTLVDMSYNLGLPRLSGFKKLRKALREGNYDKAAEEMKDSNWYKQTGNRAKENIRRMEKTKGKLDLSALSNFFMPSAEAAEGETVSPVKGEGNPFAGVLSERPEGEGANPFAGIVTKSPGEQETTQPSEIREYQPSFYERNIKPFLQTLNIVSTPKIAQKTIDVEYARGAKEPGVVKVGISPQVAGWLDKYEQWTQTPKGKYFTEQIDESGETRAGADATAIGSILLLAGAGVYGVKALAESPAGKRFFDTIGNHPLIQKIAGKQISPDQLMKIYKNIAQGKETPKERSIWDMVNRIGSFAQAKKHGITVPRFGKAVQPKIDYPGLPSPTVQMYAGMPIPFKRGDLVKIGEQSFKFLSARGDTAILLNKAGEEIEMKLSELTEETAPSPLTEEAKKYKTADEFVESQNKCLAKVKELRKKGLNKEEILNNVEYRALKEEELKINKSVEEGKKIKIKERKSLDGFENTFSPMQKSKVTESLTGEQKIIRGKPQTRRDFIRDVVYSGEAIVGKTPQGRGLLFKGGTFMTESQITKTAVDYAQYLIDTKSQLTDTWNKAHKPVSMIEQAKKYKTAEEFVEGRDRRVKIIKEGETAKITGSKLWVSITKSAKEKGRFQVTTFNKNNIPQGDFQANSFDEALKKARDEAGVSGGAELEAGLREGFLKKFELSEIEKQFLKDRQQLTDIWNKAQEEKGTPPTKSQPPSVPPPPPPPPEIKEAMNTPIVPENKNLIESKWGKFREFIQDDWLRVRKLIQQKGANVTETNNPYEAEIRYWGRIGARNEEAEHIIDKIDKDILATSKKIKVPDIVLSKEVNKFLIARHAPERNAALKKADAAGMTDKEAKSVLTGISSKPYAKEVERIANDIQNLNNKTLDTLLEGEVIDKKLYDSLRTKYKNHVPLNRVMSENDDIVQVLTSRGFGVQGTGLKRAIGSKKEISDILTNVVANYKAALARAEKNIVDNYTLRFVRDNDYFDGLIEEIKLPMMPVGKVEHKAAIDMGFLKQLVKFARSLGATFKTTGQPGRTLGTYSAVGKQITRKFATPREVLAHEAGHFFDDKYKLKQKFYKRGQTKAVAEEMLAHMRRAGESANRMKNTSERFADAFEWWLTHRDLARQDLPLFSKAMANIIKEIPDLKPLLEIKSTPKFTIEQMEQTVFARQKFSTDPKVLPLREKGKQVYLKINDPQLAMALRGVNRQKIEGLMRGVKFVTRFYAGLATRFNPEFAFSNKVRDMQETLVYLLSKKEFRGKAAFKVVAKDAQSVKDVTDYIRGKRTKGAALYHQMKMDGGTTGGLGLSTRKAVEIDLERIRRINKSAPRKAAQRVLTVVDNWNTIFEDSTRLSVYREALAEGASRNRAAVLAKEASVNFNKMGTGGPVINALYMFSNASIQGSTKMLRAMRNPKVAALVVSLLGGAIYLINEHNDRIDEEWREKVSKWDHLNSLNIAIPTSDGIRYVSIPISWGLKPIKIILDTMYSVSFDEDVNIGEAAGNIIASTIEGYNPVGGTDAISAVIPTIFDLPVDIARNRAWHGGKTKPDWNPSDPESIKYFDRLKEKAMGRISILATEELAKKGVEISPADVHYAYEQMIGGAGRFVNKVFNTIIGTKKGEIKTKEIPFVGRFYRDIPEENIFYRNPEFKNLKNVLKKQSKEKFYLKQEAEFIYDSMKKLSPQKANQDYRKIKKSNPALADKIKDVAREERLGLSYIDRMVKKLGVTNGERAKYIYEQLKTKKTNAEKNAYVKELRSKKLISKLVMKQLRYLLKKRPMKRH